MTKRKLKRLIRKAYLKGAYCSCQNKPWKEMVTIEPELGIIIFNFDYPPIDEKGHRSSGTIIEPLNAKKYKIYMLEGRKTLFENKKELLRNREERWHLK